MAKSIQIASAFTAIGFKVDKRDLDRLQKQLTNLKKQIKGLQQVTKFNVDVGLSKVRTARKEITGLASDLEKIKSKTINLSVKRSGTGGGVLGGSATKGAALGGAIGSQLGQFAPGAGIVGALGFGGVSVLKAGQRLEAVRAGLLAAAGSAERGAEEFQFMVDLSERLGINFDDNVRAYQNFIAAGRSLDFGMDKTRAVFEATASSARVLGLSAADTNGVMRAMTQILSKGTVQSEELRGQLGERLPGAVGMMAKAIGVSVEQLNKMLENGEVISKDVLPKMADAMIEFATTNGALDKAVNSNLANQERMANAWFFFKANIAESGFMDTMTEMFVEFAKVLNSNSKAGQTIGSVFEFFARVIKGVGSVLGNFIIAIGEMSTGFKVALAALTFMLLPFSGWAALIIVVVAALEELFALLRGESNLFTDFMEKATLAQKALAGLVAIFASALALRKLSSLFSGLTVATGNVDKATKSVNKLGGAIKAIRVAGGLVAAFGVGTAIGDVLNEHVLSQDTKDLIGKRVAQTLALLGNDDAKRALAQDASFQALQKQQQAIQRTTIISQSEQVIRIEPSDEFKANMDNIQSAQPTTLPEF